MKYAGEPGIDAADLKNMPGYGLTATVKGHRWAVGTLKLLDREGVAYPVELARVPETIVACAKDGRMPAASSLPTRPRTTPRRPSACCARAAWNASRYSPATGRRWLARWRPSCVWTEGCGDLLPEGKVAHIDKLKREGRNVAFVGDGINDARCWRLPTWAWPWAGLGADMAIETADVVIQTDEPSRVAAAIGIGRRTRRIVRQNIVFAIGVKVAVMAWAWPDWQTCGARCSPTWAWLCCGAERHEDCIGEPTPNPSPREGLDVL